MSGSYSGQAVPQSPDPLVACRWEKTSPDDGLQIYTLSPRSVRTDIPGNVRIEGASQAVVTGPCDLMFDFGQVNPAWLEFETDHTGCSLEASISEFNEPAVFNKGSQHPKKTAAPVRYGNTYKLELNKDLYEGVRFAWIHVKGVDKPLKISSVRLVCQTKPVNYEGSFRCTTRL